MDHETEKWVVNKVMEHDARHDGHDRDIGALKKRPAVAISWDVRVLLYAIFGVVLFLAVHR